jgi:predicted CXXCH cytochrome family protein
MKAGTFFNTFSSHQKAQHPCCAFFCFPRGLLSYFCEIEISIVLKKTSNIVSFLIFVLFAYLLPRCTHPDFQASTAQFVGGHTCLECHETEYQSWTGSDHDNAMDTAIASSVLGDFNNAEFERNGFTSRFYTKDGKYFVHTRGPGGVPGDFQIAYTFGVKPLQQYLIPFEDGRLQCLPITWDTERKRWYHLADSVYKGQEIHPDDWLYWTNNAQNWNGMCAECHSTNLQKNYNPKTHAYHTTWSEIDVSCEACHGPGSVHNQWAAIDSARRPEISNYGLVVQTGNISSKQLVDQCAYCHARRTSYGNFVHPRKELFDIIEPQLPIEPNYYPDGQIRDEDYVYSSFTQSKMHRNKVRCTNCHDAHSLKLKKEGNDLCMQCHEAEKYNTYQHHFHKTFNEEGEPLVLAGGKKIIAVGEGAQCVNCHMPGQYFMGVDFRRDHSMRIPRPDLSDQLGTPNACTQCHTDKTSQWAARYTEKWYGKSKRSHFGKTFSLAAKNDTAAVRGLLKIINNNNAAPLVKASAVHYLVHFPSPETQQTNRDLLKDPSALVRKEAVRNFRPANSDDLRTTLVPLLNDPTMMVRMEAANRLSALPYSAFDTVSLQKLQTSTREYINAMEYSADFATSRHNLGNLYSMLGQDEKAIENYREAIRIDNLFYPSKVNLAMLYNKVGNNREAESLLQEVVDEYPEMGDIYYSLGLLQAEMGKYDQSVQNLQTASGLIPLQARVWFNLFKLLDFKQSPAKAAEALNKSLELEPRNLEFLYAKIEFLLKHKRTSDAVGVAQQVLEFYPDLQDKNDLEGFIRNNS